VYPTGAVPPVGFCFLRRRPCRGRKAALQEPDSDCLFGVDL